MILSPIFDADRYTVASAYIYIVLICIFSGILNAIIAYTIVKNSTCNGSFRNNFYKVSVNQTVIEILWSSVFFIFILPSQLGMYDINMDQSDFLSTISQPVRMLLITAALVTSLERIFSFQLSELGWSIFRRGLSLTYVLVLPTFLVAIICKNMDEWTSRVDSTECDNTIDCVIEFVLESILATSIVIIIVLALLVNTRAKYKAMPNNERKMHLCFSLIAIIGSVPLLCEALRSVFAFKLHRQWNFEYDNTLFVASVFSLTLACTFRPWLLFFMDATIRAKLFSIFGQRICHRLTYSTASQRGAPDPAAHA